jgi:hypothetical protein
LEILLRKNRLLLSTVLSVLLFTSLALPVESAASSWAQKYGGVNHDASYSLVQTDDGGYALAGSTDSAVGAGEKDFWLVKTDADGNQLWSRTYGGAGNEEAQSLVQTSDGGYALAGSTGERILLVKTDASGNMEWNQTYSGTAYSLVQTGDGGYALAGYIHLPEHNTFWLVKTDADGNMQWSNTYGLGNTDYRAYSMIQTDDGGYALAGTGYRGVLGGPGIWLVKTDASGNMQWNNYEGEGIAEMGEGIAYSLVQTGDGGYALAGYVIFGYTDFWLVKTDADGNMQWDNTYDGGGDSEHAYSLVQTSDGGYALAGSTDSAVGAGEKDFWLVKTDSSGNQLWSRTYGGAGNEEAQSLVQTSDGGYALAGSTDSFGAGDYDFWLVKTDENGINPFVSSSESSLELIVIVVIAIVIIFFGLALLFYIIKRKRKPKIVFSS